MVAVTIGPVLLYGWGYFPRFVFASQAILLTIASVFLANPNLGIRKVSQEMGSVTK